MDGVCANAVLVTKWHSSVANNLVNRAGANAYNLSPTLDDRTGPVRDPEMARRSEAGRQPVVYFLSGLLEDESASVPLAYGPGRQG